jgi:SAM-dependent methyltransferase
MLGLNEASMSSRYENSFTNEGKRINDSLPKAWDEVAQKVTDIPVCGDRVRYAAAIKPLLSLPKSARILEAGCGAGRILRTLTKLGYDQVVGMELSQARLDEVRRRGECAASLVRSNEVPFSSSCFDGIVSAAVIEHVIDPRAWLGELARVSKPGAPISIITDTYMWRWLKRWGLYETIQPLDDAIWPQQLIEWGQEAKLELVSCGGFVNTSGQRFYLAKQLLRFIPRVGRFQRWLIRDDNSHTLQNETDSIIKSATEFPNSNRRNRWSCIWSYECFYWFRKI